MTSNRVMEPPAWPSDIAIIEEHKPLSLSHSIPKELDPILTPVQLIVRDVKSRQRRIALQRIGDGFDALGGVGACTSVVVDAAKRVA